MEAWHGTLLSNAEQIVESKKFIPNGEGVVYVTTNYERAHYYAVRKSEIFGAQPAVVLVRVINTAELIQTSQGLWNEYKTNPNNLKPKNYTEITIT